MNCSDLKGEPVEGVNFSERGLCPLGINMEKEGMGGSLGSGVRGGKEVSVTSGSLSNVIELIYLSSCDPRCCGESGRRKASAKDL
jgi:hypothetical protein